MTYQTFFDTSKAKETEMRLDKHLYTKTNDEVEKRDG